MGACTFLFVPGDRPERFDKAVATGADAVILDLEDAVSPERKGFARDEIRKWLAQGKRACVRINAVDTEWFSQDKELLSSTGIDCAVVPKAETAVGLEKVMQALGNRPDSIIPIIETAVGMWNALELAQHKGVSRLAFGSVDFQLDTGIVGDDLELLYARSRLVLASAVARIRPPIDGVTVAIADSDLLRRETHRARLLGFEGKLCIHPSQVEVVRAVYAPSAEALVEAQEIIKAAEAAGSVGAIRYKGKLIDKPVVERARRLLEETQA